MAAFWHTVRAMTPSMSWVYDTKADIVPPQGLFNLVQGKPVMRQPLLAKTL
jgi:hypothetical protein